VYLASGSPRPCRARSTPIRHPIATFCWRSRIGKVVPTIKWENGTPPGPAQDWGCARQPGKFRVCFLTWGGRVGWILRLVKTGAEGDGQSTDVMKINKPDDLSDIADLGLSLAEAKLLLAGVQRDISPLRPEPTPFGGRSVDAAAVFVT
jgi:hypothetical protein